MRRGRGAALVHHERGQEEERVGGHDEQLERDKRPLVDVPAEGEVTVRIHNTNTKKLIVARVPVAG